MSSQASPMFLVTFEGPWVFVVDQPLRTVTAIAVPCPGHVYSMSDGTNQMPIGQPTYELANPSAVEPMFARLPSEIHTQIEFLGMPRGSSIPDLTDASRVRCSFVFPWTALWPVKYISRSRHDAEFCDNLLSGRNFRHLQHAAAPGHAACVGLGLELPYQLGSPVALQNSTGVWNPAPDTQGNIVVTIAGVDPSPVPGNDDHFATTAAAFGLDLHLDGPDVVPRSPHVKAVDLPGSGLVNATIVQDPLLCGGNIVIDT